ncbi:MAK10-like protein [Tanacetum coccineum]
MVQNRCSFHGLRSEDPNQHLKDFLKLVDSLDLDGENRERTCLHLFQFSLHNQARNWLDCLPAGSITTWEDLTTRFLAQFFSPGRTNDPRDFAKPVNAISLPQYVLSTSDCRLIELENQVQRLMEAHLAPMQPTQVNKVTTSIVKDVEAHIGKLKQLNDFYVIDIKKDPETPFLVGRGFLTTANAVIDCRKAKIAVGERITRKDFLDCHFPGEWEIARDAKINHFKDVLVFRRMVEFLGAIPINLKSNMWESEDLINNPINWNKPPKNGDGAWHAKIRLIDPDREEFTKTIQSIPTTRMLSEREISREIIDLDHFYDT